MRNDVVPLQIVISEKTKWQPEVATRLMYQLVTNFPYLNLAIRATARQIAWVVIVPSGKRTAVKHAVEAFYSDTHVTELIINRDDDLADNCWTYQWLAARPFIFPFRLVEDCHLDPLAPLVMAMTSVNPGEEMIYNLDISAPTKDYGREVKQIFTPSVARTIWWGIRDILLPPLPASPQTMQQHRELQTLAYEKVKLPLAEVQLSVIVNAATEDRSLQLANLIGQALSQFDSDLNFITAPNNEAHKLVLSPSEVAMMWHLPTEGSYHRRVVWAKPTPVGLLQPPPTGQETDYMVLGKSEHMGQLQPVHLAYRDRRNHINVVGMTEMGKTTLLANLIRQDIQNGKTVGVIDPIGKLVSQVLPT